MDCWKNSEDRLTCLFSDCRIIPTLPQRFRDGLNLSFQRPEPGHLKIDLSFFHSYFIRTLFRNALQLNEHKEIERSLCQCFPFLIVCQEFRNQATLAPMNRFTRYILLFSLLPLTFTGCEDNGAEEELIPPSSLNKILPLGASRVEGARPFFESYRYELWKLLVDGDWDFDYVGTQEDDSAYPTYEGLAFDDDHEGRGGWTSGQILSGLPNWLTETGSPDIVLFSSPGGNDALLGLPYEQAISNVNAIIDILQEDNPEVVIIIEQLAPARSDAMTPALSDYFNRMQDEVVSIAASQSDQSSRVLVVNMSAQFGDQYYADEVHYNEAGAAEVARRYFEVMQQVLVSSN